MGWGKKAPPPPPVPDYAALAQQQAKLDQEATDRQTQANRVNQVTSEGSLTWSKDPTTGQWTQTQTLSPELQAARAQQQKIQQGLAETAGGLMGNAQAAVKDPFSLEGMSQVKDLQQGQAPTTEGLPDWRGIDESQLGEYKDLDYSAAPQLADSGFGGVEKVQQAIMARQQPMLEQARNREMARLKAQGFTEGSSGLMRAQTQAGQRETDASQQAILGANQAYGDIFSRSLQARQQGVSEADKQSAMANALRGQKLGEQQTLAANQNAQRAGQLGEQFQMSDAETRRSLLERSASEDDRQRQIQEAMMLRQMPLNELNAFNSGSQIQNPQFAEYKGASLAGAPDMMGATAATYKAQMDAINAANAKKSGAMSGLLGLAGTAVGAYFGGPAGAAVGGKAGSALGEYFG
jgi:hypothetical protein